MQLLGTGRQLSGKTCRVAYGTGPTALAHNKFSCNETGEDLDTTNFESYLPTFNQPQVGTTPAEGIVGVQKLDWNAGGDYDAGLNPYDNPPGFYPRDDFPKLYFFESVIDLTFWYQPWSRVRSANNSGEVNGKVAFEASGMNNGTYTRPTGSYPVGRPLRHLDL